MPERSEVRREKFNPTDDALLNSCYMYMTSLSEGEEEKKEKLTKAILELWLMRFELGEDLPDIRDYTPQWNYSDLVYDSQMIAFISAVQARLEKKLTRRLEYG